jgi:chromosome segregation ATPase
MDTAILITILSAIGLLIGWILNILSQIKSQNEGIRKPLEEQINLLKEQLKVTESRSLKVLSESLNRHNEMMRDELEHLLKEVQEYQASLKTADEEIQKYQASLKTTVGLLQKLVNEIEPEIKGVNTDAQRLKGEADKAKEEAKRLNEKVKRLEMQIEKSEAETERQEMEMNRLRAMVEEADGQTEKNEALSESMKARVQELEAMYNELLQRTQSDGLR